MPIKIYTYINPYKLDCCHFWEEIRGLPHLCVAQTQANAIRDIFGKNMSRTLICPIEKVLQHSYSQWHGNISLYLRQFSELTEVFTSWLKSNRLNDALYSAFKLNKREILQALRLFLELDLTSDKLHTSKANPEQILFVELLKLAQGGSLGDNFILQELTDHDALKQAMSQTAQAVGNETIEKLENRMEKLRELGDENEITALQKRINYEHIRYSQIVECLQTNISSIVIHGIHQFSPMHLRFIQQLDSFGVEIIFLYNYQPNFKEIYATWNYIYRQFGVIPESDRNITTYSNKQDSKSNLLAISMGSLYNLQIKDSIRSIINLEGPSTIQPPLFVEFDNIAEFGNYVARHFDDALSKDKNNPLAVMDEQIYSVGNEIQDLLKVYYPDYAGDRHFLAYPIGQFFVALYRMWDPLKKQLKLDMAGLSECLASGLLRKAPSNHLLAIYYNTRIFYEDVKYYDDFTDRMQKYINCYLSLNTRQPITPEDTEGLRRLSVFNPELVCLEDLEMLRDTITELNSLAQTLFVDKNRQDEFITLKRHFEKLEEFIRQDIPELAQEEETRLIDELLSRFSNHDYDEQHKSTIDDLREGIYYYLRQKNREHEKWIVRNFEQIDGDVLRSREQFRLAVQKDPANPPIPVYHFAGLSDSEMNKTIDDLLPWPLTERFMNEAYFPVDIIYQVYIASLGEYRNFLRYALFYGLCYNECNVRLSYVKNVAQEACQPYYLLKILGLEPRRETITYLAANPVHIQQPDISSLEWKLRGLSRKEAMSFFLCPYRYLLDYVLNREPVPNDKFLYRFYYVNLLIARVWQQVQEKPVVDVRRVIKRYLNAANMQLERFFPYWRGVNDIFDLKAQAENYILNICTYNWGKTILKYDSKHMAIRLLYKKALFSIDPNQSSWEHPYKEYQNIARYTMKDGDPVIEISLHKISDPLSSKLIAPVLDYMHQAEEKYVIPEEWCMYCSHRITCLVPFAVPEPEIL